MNAGTNATSTFASGQRNMLWGCGSHLDATSWYGSSSHGWPVCSSVCHTCALFYSANKARPFHVHSRTA